MRYQEGIYTKILFFIINIITRNKWIYHRLCKVFFQGQNWNHSSFCGEFFPWCWICPSKLVNRILRTVTRSMQIVIASLYKAPFFKSVWVLSLKRCTKTSKIPAITYKEDIFLMKCWVFTIHSPVWLNSRFAK